MNSYFELIRNNWEEILKNLKINYEISDIAFKTWLIPLIPIKIEDMYLFISCKDQTAAILISKFQQMLEVQIQEQLDIPIGVIFCERKNNLDDSSNDRKLCLNNGLNPLFTFDTLIKGANNALAYAAALKVSEDPGFSYNPFFIYGGPGLGKTHMMNAIAHRILKNFHEKKVVYVTSENFTNELIHSIREKTSTEFRNKYRNIDVLLIDDIQFIIGKETTQEEFFHTFNALYSANKQIIISSDKPPRDIETLEERLKSRFQSGLTVDIQTPNFETRMAILNMYQERESIFFPYPILEYICNNINSNIRNLEGAFKNLVALTSLTYGKEHASKLSLEEAKNILKDLISPSKYKEINPDLITEVVSDFTKISVEDIKGKSKVASIAYARHLSIYLCRYLLKDMTQQQIGNYFNKKDHSTVINACNNIEQKLKINDGFKSTIDTLIKKIKRDI